MLPLPFYLVRMLMPLPYLARAGMSGRVAVSDAVPFLPVSPHHCACHACWCHVEGAAAGKTVPSYCCWWQDCSFLLLLLAMLSLGRELLLLGVLLPAVCFTALRVAAMRRPCGCSAGALLQQGQGEPWASQGAPCRSPVWRPQTPGEELLPALLLQPVSMLQEGLCQGVPVSMLQEGLSPGVPSQHLAAGGALVLLCGLAYPCWVLPLLALGGGDGCRVARLLPAHRRLSGEGFQGQPQRCGLAMPRLTCFCPFLS